MTEDVITYLRARYKVDELIPTTMEESFAGYNILVMFWGLGIDHIKPKLRPKKSIFKELHSGVSVSPFLSGKNNTV